MAERNIIGNTADHLQEQMKRTLDVTSGLQTDRPGTRKRTTQEKNKLWNSLISLGREERQAILLGMAERSGHQDGEQSPCELCQFIASKAVEK